MKENKQIMARNIQHYMRKNNIKATEVCEALNIKQNTFSDWVNAKTYPRIDAIERLARYFHVSKAYLVEDIHEVDFLTDDEAQLLIDYRNADTSTQESIRRLLAYQKLLNQKNEEG
jgi:transcriptional regulator with XRE-family HTH domain